MRLLASDVIGWFDGDLHCKAFGLSSFEPLLIHEITNESSIDAETRWVWCSGVGITNRLPHLIKFIFKTDINSNNKTNFVIIIFVFSNYYY